MKPKKKSNGKSSTAKQEKSKTSCKKIELKNKHTKLFPFEKNIIQFYDINHESSGTIISKKQSEV